MQTRYRVFKENLSTVVEITDDEMEQNEVDQLIASVTHHIREVGILSIAPVVFRFMNLRRAVPTLCDVINSYFEIIAEEHPDCADPLQVEGLNGDILMMFGDAEKELILTREDLKAKNLNRYPVATE